MARAGALILAAGAASRFGSDKRQALGPWQGPLLHHVLGLYRPLFADLAVVIGPDDRFGAEACAAFGVTALINPEPDLGMGRSLAVGIGWLAGRGLDAALIGLADMPWISSSVIARVTAALLAEMRLVAPLWRGEIGFPRGIPAAYFAQLASLSGDRGAGALLDWRSALLLEEAEQGVVRDIDRPEDVFPDFVKRLD